MTLYGLLQEAYCWRVAPQQSPFPLQLPDAKVVINKYSDNSNVKALLKMPPLLHHNIEGTCLWHVGVKS